MGSMEVKHDQKTCPDCQILKAGNGTRSMGFYEEELHWRMCRRQLNALERQSEERREWDYYHA